MRRSSWFSGEAANARGALSSSLHVDDFPHNRFRGRTRISGLHDGAGDHEMVGAKANALGRRHDALLVARIRTRRPDAGRDDEAVLADDGAYALRFRRGADDAVDIEVTRLCRAAGDEFRSRDGGVSRLDEIVVVVRSEHGHGEDFQVRSGFSGDGRAHGLRIGVDRQERGAEAGHGAHAFLHRVADVVELEIEKDLLALSDQLPGELEAARIGELVADLVEGAGVPDTLDDGAGLLDGGDVQTDDELVANVSYGNGIRRKRHRSAHGWVTLL